MSSRYDQRTTTFTPEGRLLQVEYAVQSINNAGSSVGILTKDGIILGAEKQTVSKLLEKSKENEKMYKIDDHIICAMSGMASDANYLLGEARKYAQDHFYTYKEPVPVELLVKHVCDYKQFYTQYGSYRPYGVSFMYAGFDNVYKFQLYCSDPSGNYTGWKAHATGVNSMNAIGLLKQDYKEDSSLEDGLLLVVKVLLKTMDTANPSAEKFEIVTLTQDGEGNLKYAMLTDAEVKALLDKNTALIAAEEEKKKKE